MATFIFSKFQIGAFLLVTDKSKKEATPLNPDKVFGYSVVDCSLTKEQLNPNEFTFTLRRDLFKKTEDLKQYKVVNYLIGKKIECQGITVLDGANTSSLCFIGTIAKVSIKGLNITCVAYSNDAFLQGPPKSRCFLGKKLKEIVSDVVGNVISTKIEFHGYLDDLVFPYIVQYNESDYDFLVRLAKRFGAFFYTMNDRGIMRLVVGQVPNPRTRDLVGNPNVVGTSYELQTSDPNYYFVGHNYEDNTELDSQTHDFDDLSANQLVEMSVKGSTKKDNSPVYRIDYPHVLPVDPPKTFIDDYSVTLMYCDASRLGTCKFISYLFDIEPGNIIKINDNGKMVVLSTHLTWDCNGSPQNEVTAMLVHNEGATVDMIFAPYMDFAAYPKSSAQRAVVVDNFDPKGMGRVQVRFVWQKDSSLKKEDYPWIRIAQPYGGNNKGCYILPEVDEEVMVGFEHDNMEKPFVMGTLFHGCDSRDDQATPQMPDQAWVEKKDGENKNEANEVKAFRTKNGHTIEFHDTKDGNGFIRIYGYEAKKKEGQDKPKPNYDIYLSTSKIKNKEENYKVKTLSIDNQAKATLKEEDCEIKELHIMVKSNNGDIMLDAGEGDIILNANNIRINAKNDRTTLIGNDDIVQIGNRKACKAKQSSMSVTEDRCVIVGKKDSFSSKQAESSVDETQQMFSKKLVQKATIVQVEAKSELDLSSEATVNIESDAMIKIKTEELEEKGEMTTVKGMILKVDGETTTLKGTNLLIDASIGTRKGNWTDV